MALDLKDPQHLAVLKALLAKADVLVQNLAPGAATRMGLDAPTLERLMQTSATMPALTPPTPPLPASTATQP